MHSGTDIVARARQVGVTILAFNVPYLPMVEPVVRAVVDTDCFAMIATARLEWLKFAAQGPAAVMAEFARHRKPDYVWLHLDHVPVIDEDNQRVDYVSVIKEAIDLGYQSVMVDGSRLDLDGNIQATRRIAGMAHKAGIPCEAELGAVLGHEAGPLPPYEELFASGRGFTDVAEARRFVRESGCNWLSVAVGNVHGAVSGVLRDQKKVEARLNLDHLQELAAATAVPLVLHGGSGIQKEYVRRAIGNGIAKINVGTEIRQAYEAALRETGSTTVAQDAVHKRTAWLIREHFGMAGIRQQIMPRSDNLVK